MENEVIKELQRGQITFGFDESSPIHVSIDQFYGIEINDFAVTVAKTALWIAESQMMKETEDIVHMNLDFLPLTTNAFIVEGNALELDWESVVSKYEVSYIMGNPPFVGARLMEQGSVQKKEVQNIFGKIKDVQDLRQFLILRRDALKGMRVEGMEINNLIGSMLQDYAYILKGIVYDESMETAISEIIIKIPMEIQSEFENKYNINDLLIGHVSIVGIYKGIVKEEFITSNTFTYFQEADTRKGKQAETDGKIIKSNTPPVSNNILPNKSNKNYHFVDTLAIIQDVAFKLEEVPAPKLHWWNKFGIWLSTLWRK